MPFNRFGESGRDYPVSVIRVFIPFTGDRTLLQYAPNPCSMTFPQGEVCGDKIQFDVIMWGSPDDAHRMKNEVQRNRELLATYAAAINEQVKEFNESLPSPVESAFTAKLDDLTKQNAILDDLGIPEAADEPEPPAMASRPNAPRAKKGKAQVVHIIQYIENQYVQQLNQTNNNRGDVNNAIQSD